MDKHIITLNGLEEFLNDQSITYASSYGKNSSKSLRCTFHHTYEVWNNKEMVLETDVPEVAIALYNELK